MPKRKAGIATTKAPTPPAHKLKSNAQPTGTAHTNGIARFNPWLAAKAVDRVVFGPGVKLAAVVKANKAVSSVAVMACSLAANTITLPVQFINHKHKLYCYHY